MRVEATAADIHVAVVSGNLEALVQHVARGADVNGLLRGITPLGCAISRKDWDTARLLISLGADVNQRTRDMVGREEPPLCLATRLGCAEGLLLLLRTPGIKVGRKDFFGKTAVWHATKHRQPHLVHLLLLHGASSRSATSYADCPLWLCARYGGRESIAALLLASGCRQLHCDGSGRDALTWARARGDTQLMSRFRAAGLTGGTVPSLQWLVRRAYWMGQQDGMHPSEGIPPRLRAYLSFRDIVPHVG